MKFSKADAAFTAAMLAGIALLSGALYLHNSRRTAGKGETIGKVFFKREVAMRKFSDRMVWEDVENGSALYSLDAVMTGNYSDAELVLNSGLKLKLEANTLVELDLEQDGLKLKLSGGGIKTAGSQSAQTVVTTTDGQAINVTQGDASIRTRGSQTAVEVKEGKVEVVGKDGKTQTVAKDEVLAEGKKARITLQLTGLMEDAIILAAGKTGKVTLGCSGNARTAEVSASSDMAGARQLSLENGKASTTLAAGDWYSRCKGDGGAISAVRHFRIVNSGNYQVLRPEAETTTFDAKPTLRFDLKAPRGVSETKLEVADNPQFENPVYAQNTTRTSLSIDLPKAGRYYYRLTPATQAGRVESQLSPVTGSVDVQRSQKKTALGFLSLSAPTFSRAQVEAGTAVVGFEGADRAAYEILARGDGKVVRAGETKNASVVLPANLAPGKYTVRLKSPSGEESQLPIEIRDKTSVVLVNPANETLIYLPPGQKGATLDVVWRSPSEAGAFQVLLAEDGAMQRIIRKSTVAGREHRFTDLAPRVYFVKVLALEGDIARAETVTHRVAIEEKLPPVAQVSPKDEQKVDITRSAGLNLKWQPVAGASSYEVKLFQKRKGALVLVEKRTTSSAALSVADFKKYREGDLVWEVSAQQTNKAGRVIQKSEPSRSSVNLSFGPAPAVPEIVPTVE